MAPAKAAARTVSQKAFDEMVEENIEDLGMDPAEALNDAIQTLTLQGVDLSGIVTSVPGESNPVIECLGKLREEKPLPEAVELLDELRVLCGDKESGNAAIAAKNGAVELIICVCAKFRDEYRQGLASGLKALASVIHDPTDPQALLIADICLSEFT
ncbi:armadillo repeat-containing protein 6-like [Salvia hispanica]|uniref:armadillo repeat-containing protein 6-like n=1 Tax=Salvia hispanica TaxID=49212 RepID=UPI0020092B06|nr:armadillo repeat-containing protein 6-like [Salvia hispanica]